MAGKFLELSQQPLCEPLQYISDMQGCKTGSCHAFCFKCLQREFHLGLEIAMAATTQPETRHETDAHTRHFYERYVHIAQHTGNSLWDGANKITRGYIAFLAQAAKNF